MKIDLVQTQQNGVKVDFLQKADIKKHPFKKTLTKAGFDAAQDSVCFLYAKDTLVVGIEKNTQEHIRTAAAAALNALRNSNAKAANFTVNKKNIKAVVEGLILGGYEFTRYKSKPKKEKLKNIYLQCEDIASLSQAFEEAVITGCRSCRDNIPFVERITLCRRR